MMKRTILALCTTLPALATELPPAIPDGPVTYDAVSYQAQSPQAWTIMPEQATVLRARLSQSSHFTEAEFEVREATYSVLALKLLGRI